MKLSIKALKIAMVLAQGLTSSFLIFTIFRLNILQAWQNYTIAAVLALLFLLCAKALIFPKKRHKKTTESAKTDETRHGKATKNSKSAKVNKLNEVADDIPQNPKLLPQIFAAILALIVTAGAIFAYHYVNPVSDFIAGITKESKTHVKIYNLLTPKLTDNDQKRTLDDYREQEIGFLTLDPYKTKAEEALQEKIPFSSKPFEDLDTLISALDAKSIPAIVIEAERFEALAEIAATKNAGTPGSAHTSSRDLATFADRVEVTYTFEISVDDTNYDSTVDVTKDPFIVYISGTDSRRGIHGVARSDVNILAAVNPSTAKILLLTIPRDTYVQLHGTTGIKDKLTHAGIYGIDMSKTTIEDFLNIKIDHTIKVSFATVVNIVDAIGKIEIDSDTAMTLEVEGKDKKCTYVVGKQMLDGDCALRYARERKTYFTGDNHRGQNQQQVLTAIINKITSTSSLLADYPRILAAADGTFETSFSYDEITSLVREQLAKGSHWQIESIQIAGKSAYSGTYSMGASLPLYVMNADPASVKTAQDKIAEVLTK